jgi:sulfide dehydrogenase cytochrome subunit
LKKRNLVREESWGSRVNSMANIENLMKSCAALVCVSFAFTASAADVEKLVESCFACHGKNGVSTELKVPTIAGYSSDYFGFSLSMYTRSERPCVDFEYPAGSKKGVKTNMCEIVKDFGESEIEQIGEYFEKQKFVRTVQKFDPELAKKGEAIHFDKCEVCHTKSGSLAADNIGILGGQKMDYLREQIRFVKDGKRFTSKKMKMRLDALSDQDMEAVAHYYGSFQ